MIEIAKNKLNNIKGNIDFTVLDMLKIKNYYKDIKFDFILCFGNTIVHLLSEKNIKKSFVQMKQLLKNKGKLIIQLLNYDFILKNKIDKLPLIENDKIIFKRFYAFKKNTELIDFKTELFIKTLNKTFTSSIKLLPIKKEHIIILLKDTEFTDINYYSGFNKENYNENSLPLIIEASVI